MQFLLLLTKFCRKTNIKLTAVEKTEKTIKLDMCGKKQTHDQNNIVKNTAL